MIRAAEKQSTIWLRNTFQCMADFIPQRTSSKERSQPTSATTNGETESQRGVTRVMAHDVILIPSEVPNFNLGLYRRSRQYSSLLSVRSPRPWAQPTLALPKIPTMTCSPSRPPQRETDWRAVNTAHHSQKQKSQIALIIFSPFPLRSECSPFTKLGFGITVATCV